MPVPRPSRRRLLSAVALLVPVALGAGLALPGQARPTADGRAAPAPRGCAPQIAVVNETARPVQELFMRASGTAGWGPDLLGDAVLRPGQRFAVTPAGAGPVDIMLLAPDGTARVLWRQSACAVRQVTLRADLSLRAE